MNDLGIFIGYLLLLFCIGYLIGEINELEKRIKKLEKLLKGW